MQNFLRFSGSAAAVLAFAAFAPTAVAQNVRVFTCQGRQRRPAGTPRRSRRPLDLGW
jgi:hypothetical protein